MNTTPTPLPRTNPGMPEEIIPGKSQYGQDITNERWHRHEADRWSRSGRLAFVRSNGGGRIYLCEGIPLPGDSVHYLPGREVMR